MPTLNRRVFFTCAAASAAAPLAVAAPAPTVRPRAAAQVKQNPALAAARSRNVRGKILYISDDGTERGREWFGFTYRKDRQITLRAYCEIDDAQVQRDVVQTMDERYHPLDCFVRLHVKGEFLGTGWIRVTDTEAECEVSNVVLGRVHQRVPLAVPAESLVSHPISSDALLMAAFDHSKPERIQSWEGGLSTSPLLDGASGPFISVSRQRSVEYVGPEKITTPAGTFDTHHYRLLMTGSRPDGRKPSYDIWCTHPDYLIVRGEVGGYLNNATGFGRYELVELSE
jgi:hypothetical protein